MEEWLETEGELVLREIGIKEVHIRNKGGNNFNLFNA